MQARAEEAIGPVGKGSPIDLYGTAQSKTAVPLVSILVSGAHRRLGRLQGTVHASNQTSPTTECHAVLVTWGSIPNRRSIDSRVWVSLIEFPDGKNRYEDARCERPDGNPVAF